MILNIKVVLSSNSFHQNKKWQLFFYRTVYLAYFQRWSNSVYTYMTLYIHALSYCVFTEVYILVRTILQKP